MNLDNLGALIDGDGPAGDVIDADNAFDAMADELQATQDQLKQARAQREEVLCTLQSAYRLIESLNQANSELRSALGRVDNALEVVRKVRAK